LAQVGIHADIFPKKPIPIQGRKELSKEELRQRYIYPSSVKRITELEKSLLIEEDIREFEEKVARQIKAATKPNLDFLTPSQKARIGRVTQRKRLSKQEQEQEKERKGNYFFLPTAKKGSKFLGSQPFLSSMFNLVNIDNQITNN